MRYIVGFGLVDMAISTNPKHTIYRNLYENTGPGVDLRWIRWHVFRDVPGDTQLLCNYVSPNMIKGILHQKMANKGEGNELSSKRLCHFL